MILIIYNIWSFENREFTKLCLGHIPNMNQNSSLICFAIEFSPASAPYQQCLLMSGTPFQNAAKMVQSTEDRNYWKSIRLDFIGPFGLQPDTTLCIILYLVPLPTLSSPQWSSPSSPGDSPSTSSWSSSWTFHSSPSSRLLSAPPRMHSPKMGELVA